ncbi:uncharacterized protein LOC143284548 [Babylonia areolata]|uniref:uncharacterized protein LOC143284548 n=1 Tax=Babylonia areolata TaxID=304850 RepID=UPI003FD4175C
MSRVVVVLLVVLVVVMVILAVHNVEAKKKTGKVAAKRAMKRRMHTIVNDLQSNVTALWREVKQLGQPVHVHLHGDDHVMDPDHHHHHHHGSHQDLNKSKDDDDDDGSREGDHDHKGHKHHHDHKDHHKSFDAKDKKMSHLSLEEKKKMAMTMKKEKKKMMMMMSGQEEEEEEEEEEWEKKYMHKGHAGTHVHIHLHTGGEEKEKEEEEGGMGSKHHLHGLPPLSKIQEYRYARCDVVPNSAVPLKEREAIKGTIHFRQMPSHKLEIKALLGGFKKANHKHLRGIHGHEFGDMTDGCNSLGGHINPFGVSHGGPGADHRHLGDFGNIEVQENGTATRSFTDAVASLFGSNSMLGSSMVIHTGPDDHGKGASSASKSYGNAGGRSACCVVVKSPKPKGVWSGHDD